jgi:hypothetical protein
VVEMPVRRSRFAYSPAELDEFREWIPTVPAPQASARLASAVRLGMIEDGDARALTKLVNDTGSYRKAA